ncbi:MAG: hypothetical protein AAF577_07315 [Pseudomonadota bacterium]
MPGLSTHPGPLVVLLATVLMAGGAGAQIERQGGRLVDTSKPPEQRTVTDGTDASAADRAAILQAVAGVLGDGALASNGRNLPEAVEDAIVEGDPLPEGANPQPVSEALETALAPHRIEATRWVRVGEHLVAADGRGTAVLILYDALD